MRAILGGVRAGCNHRPGRVRPIGVSCKASGRLAGDIETQPSLGNTRFSADWYGARLSPELLRRALAGAMPAVRFLNDPEPVARIERVRALLKALGAARLGEGMTGVVVTAEAPTSGKRRIDVLIEWHDSSAQRHAAAIKAKLGHHVTSGQLPAYRKHLRKIAKDRGLSIVAVPRLTGGTEGSLRRNHDRRWAIWRDLLTAYERTLPVDYDDAEYLRFRRTLWDRTG